MRSNRSRETVHAPPLRRTVMALFLALTTALAVAACGSSSSSGGGGLETPVGSGTGY